MGDTVANNFPCVPRRCEILAIHLDGIAADVAQDRELVDGCGNLQRWVAAGQDVVGGGDHRRGERRQGRRISWAEQDALIVAEDVRAGGGIHFHQRSGRREGPGAPAAMTLPRTAASCVPVMTAAMMMSPRSGKIMRRVLAAISNNEDAGDISTLANPEIVDQIRKMKF
jgi:hypothetical protein